MSLGVLLINLGTPKSPRPDDVGEYLHEFLMDRYVIDVPAPLRWFLVNVLIVPKRKYKSGEAYEKIFTSRGSPLLFHTSDLASALQKRMGSVPVRFGMRYGQPNISDGLAQLKAQGCQRIVVVPLYPQYAESSTLTATEKCREAAAALNLELFEVEAFYSHPAFISSLTERTKSAIQSWGGWGQFDSLLLSFHSLPERHIKKMGPAHCLQSQSCCDRVDNANRLCYRAHCFATARELACQLDLPKSKWEISFQSRLGRSKWIQPTTDDLYIKLAQEGKKRIAVICPSFVSDCLETLEEIQIRGAADFKKAGGETLKLIPCLNSEEYWVSGLESIVREKI